MPDRIYTQTVLFLHDCQASRSANRSQTFLLTRRDTLCSVLQFGYKMAEEDIDALFLLSPESRQKIFNMQVAGRYQEISIFSKIEKGKLEFTKFLEL